MMRDPAKKAAPHEPILLLALILVAAAAGCTQAPGQTGPQAPPGQPALSTGIPDGLDEALQEIDQMEELPETAREFSITARQWEFVPARIEVDEGDLVVLHVKSIDVTHGLWLPEFGIDRKLEPGATVTVQFVASRGGTFSMICSVYCGDGHFQMKGEIVVNPREFPVVG